NAEHFCRLSLVPIGQFEHLFNLDLLRGADRSTGYIRKRSREVKEVYKVFRSFSLLKSEVQVFGPDGLPVRQNDGAFNRVLQLANIAWPGILLQSARGLGSELEDLPVEVLRKFLHEKLGE